MKVFHDRWTNDEYFTDAQSLKLVDDFVYIVKSNMITQSNSIDASLLGANPSAEEEEEGVDDGVVKINDVKDVNNFSEVPLSSGSEVVALVKPMIKKLCDAVKEDGGDVDAYKKKIMEFITDVKKNFKDHSFYYGSSGVGEGMVVFSKWEDDGITESFYFLKAGLVEEKC
ncbi:hypothetical protein Ciccas_003449 [Cichlidogyrus casuarinus]|uniref:TCTP domain-containing protein n=1 Tax=Cichlidogyrus casuarinus TaxID=1844966 RepID=A0ABD2QGM1_9PLAT